MEKRKQKRYKKAGKNGKKINAGEARLITVNVIYGYFAHVTYPIEFSSNTTQRNAHLLVRIAIDELPKVLFFLLFYLILKSD
jgi:hypothetical protein